MFLNAKNPAIMPFCNTFYTVRGIICYDIFSIFRKAVIEKHIYKINEIVVKSASGKVQKGKV